MKKEQNIVLYRFIRLIVKIFAALMFRCRIRRNELKNVQGPCVVLANHECMLDFINLSAMVRRPIRFVISDSFYNSLSGFSKILRQLGVIPKQQFETSLPALRKMKQIVNNGEILGIYPAGLMCEDGVSTPIPQATYKFLTFLDTDVYIARTYGAYFVMPKWSPGIHPGRTEMDIYKLLSREELKQLSVSQIRERVEQALLFDAYADQETLRVRYRHANDLTGLENTLYHCPECGKDFSMEISEKTTIRCAACGYAEQADAFGFLHRRSACGTERRYVSHWNQEILEDTKRLLEDPEFELSDETQIHMIDHEQHKYVPVGSGRLTFSRSGISLVGTVKDEPLEIHIPAGRFPTLPFVPGKRLEVQYEGSSYRCVLSNGQLAGKFINLIKVSYLIPERKKKVLQ